ncbi:SH3 domain-containing protein [Aquimarina sp. I32.4]|uniref:SH3 domain-containing protein n=1 Tax=Aquimarina sp. I32.4 TaxID=2053903 RepID=UPI000CDE5932|nr:SH3 domain-containing protein [Aquimarina sp. I32.4]
MRNLLFLFLLLTVSISAQKTYYVTAKNGLIVRNQPNVKGKRIGKFPYGVRVNVLHKTNHTFSVKQNSNSILGHWVEVSSVSFPYYIESESEKMYVFDGFLSSEQVFIEDIKYQLSLNIKNKDTYRLLTKNNPFAILGDFDGNGIDDYAMIVSEKEDKENKGKIIILYRGNADQKIVVFGNENDPFDITNYNWHGYFEMIPKGSKIYSNWDDEKDDFITEDVPEHKKHTLVTDAFFIHQSESCGGGYIYWQHQKFNWMQVE